MSDIEIGATFYDRVEKAGAISVYETKTELPNL